MAAGSNSARDHRPRLRRRLLHFGDDGGGAYRRRSLRVQRMDETLAAGDAFAACATSASRLVRALRCWISPRLAREDAFEEYLLIAEFSASADAARGADESINFARAAPDATAARALSIPVAIDSASSATYSAAPALSSTMSRTAPGLLSSASSTRSRDSAASFTRNASLADMSRPKSRGWISYSRTSSPCSSPMQACCHRA